MKYLISKKPDCVFVEYTHPFVCFSPFLYSKLFRKSYILDGHTSPFIDKYSEGLLEKLSYFFMSHSKLVIIHNEELKRNVEKRYPRLSLFVLEDKIPEFKLSKKSNTCSKYVVVVGSFAPDEPTSNVIEAAKHSPHVNFKITGSLKRADTKLISSAPTNVEFTDFLPESQYIDLLRNADAVLCLVNTEYTLLCGGYEAISLEKPLIVSDFKTLIHYYGKNVVYTNNTPTDIQNKVKYILKNKTTYKAKSIELKLKKCLDWKIKFINLKKGLL